MTVAAFFDMDNTLLRVDTGMSWTRFLYRRGGATFIVERNGHPGGFEARTSES